MTTETHSQPQSTQLSYPCTYGECTSRATWSIWHDSPSCWLTTVCDIHLPRICIGDKPYTIGRLPPYEATGEVVLHGITAKETQVVGLALTMARWSDQEWAKKILEHGGTKRVFTTLTHATLLLWQQVNSPPACSFLPTPTVGEVLVARRVAEWPFGSTWWQARITEGQVVGRPWDATTNKWGEWGAMNPAWRWLDCRPLKLTDDIEATPIGRCECESCKRLPRLRPPAETSGYVLKVLRTSLELCGNPPSDQDVQHIKALGSDVAWALDYFMQRGAQFPNGSILINGVEYPMPAKVLTREDVIRMINPQADAGKGDAEVRITMGRHKAVLLEEGDVFNAADIIGAAFQVSFLDGMST